MRTNEPIRLDTHRLQLREVDTGDLPELHQVFASNPEFMSMREEIETYDLESVTRYWEAATLDPERHILLVVHKNTGIVIGLVDFVEQSPADGNAWIGLVMIHRRHQRRGFGTEAVHAVTDLVASKGHRGVRMGVIEHNEAGLAFARSVGFERFGQANSAAVGTEQRVALMELVVDPPDGE